MSEQELLNAGYRMHVNSGVFHEPADFFFQKRLRDEHGTRYFINFYHYPAQMGMSESWMCSLHQNEPHMTFEQHRVTSREEAERNCEVFWHQVAQGTYYERDGE